MTCRCRWPHSRVRRQAAAEPLRDQVFSPAQPKKKPAGHGIQPALCQRLRRCARSVAAGKTQQTAGSIGHATSARGQGRKRHREQGSGREGLEQFGFHVDLFQKSKKEENGDASSSSHRWPPDVVHQPAGMDLPVRENRRRHGANWRKRHGHQVVSQHRHTGQTAGTRTQSQAARLLAIAAARQRGCGHDRGLPQQRQGQQYLQTAAKPVGHDGKGQESGGPIWMDLTEPTPGAR